jgi:hypothetical protein
MVIVGLAARVFAWVTHRVVQQPLSIPASLRICDQCADRGRQPELGEYLRVGGEVSRGQPPGQIDR